MQAYYKSYLYVSITAPKLRPMEVLIDLNCLCSCWNGMEQGNEHHTKILSTCWHWHFSKPSACDIYFREWGDFASSCKDSVPAHETPAVPSSSFSASKIWTRWLDILRKARTRYLAWLRNTCVQNYCGFRGTFRCPSMKYNIPDYLVPPKVN